LFTSTYPREDNNSHPTSDLERTSGEKKRVPVLELSKKDPKKARQEDTIEEAKTGEEGNEQVMFIVQPEKPIEKDERASWSSKAVKSDDANIPVYLWDERILLSLDAKVSDEEGIAALNTLRRVMLHYFEAQEWESEEDKEKIIRARKTAIKFAMKASWWDRDRR
jgi:hypothetical protein